MRVLLRTTGSQMEASGHTGSKGRAAGSGFRFCAKCRAPKGTGKAVKRVCAWSHQRAAPGFHAIFRRLSHSLSLSLSLSLCLSLSLSLSRSLALPPLCLYSTGVGVFCVFERGAMNRDSGISGPPTPAYQKPRRPRRVSQAGCPFRVAFFPCESHSRRVWP